MMFLNAVEHISEVVTGLIGAGFIAAAFLDSVRYNRRNGTLETIPMLSESKCSAPVSDRRGHG